MNRTLVIGCAAEAEIDQVADWYQRHNLDAVLGFRVAVDRTIDFIREYPEQYQVVYRQTRRALVHGYPYALFYTVDQQQIVVIACLHMARDPDACR